MYNTIIDIIYNTIIDTIYNTIIDIIYNTIIDIIYNTIIDIIYNTIIDTIYNTIIDIIYNAIIYWQKSAHIHITNAPIHSILIVNNSVEYEISTIKIMKENTLMTAFQFETRLSCTCHKNNCRTK